ncbi:MAG: peptidoglycan-binding protein LysM [Acidiferrobacterales bacterium]|nr:peptidoglycan-binding protein LysM [Acidiferrobacterales bacterium]
MGLFDFAANIGKKVFGIGDADAAEQVKAEIEAVNPGVSNLEVSMDGETCTISGDCDSAAAKEKTVLIAGNTMGVSTVSADGLNAPEPIVEEDDQYYVIEKGDTLWGIAAKTMGNGAKYTEIFEANKEVIQDPDKIFPGQKIRIPK